MKKEELFVGIDVSKLTLDVCFLNEETESFQIGNTASSVKRLMKQIMKNNPNKNVHLCIENTGKYSWRLMEIVPEYDVKFYVVNPLHLKRSLGLIRGKNDKIDAIRIASFTKKNHEELKEYVQEREVITTIKVLLTERRFRVSNRKQLRIKIKDTQELSNKKLAKRLIRDNEDIIKKLSVQIGHIEAEIKALISQDQVLSQMSKTLKSIPGLGDVLSWNFIVKTNEFKSVTDPRKLACYCGVVPFENRSGTSVFGRSRVSLLADKKFKKNLHLGAMRAIQMNNDFQVYYKRKVDEGKNKMSVLNAVRNKIIHTAYALIKNQDLYQNRLVLS
jgi:transposase